MTIAAPVESGPVEGRSARLDRALADLLSQAPQMHAAAVVSFDGLPMASALPVGMDEDRVAAMSAALLSLGERAAAGLGRGELSQVYVEGDNGTVFLVSADDEAVLVAVAGKGAKVGLMLFEAKQAAEAVANALRADDADDEARRTAVAVAAAAAAEVPPTATVGPEPVVETPEYVADLPTDPAAPVDGGAAEAVLADAWTAESDSVAAPLPSDPWESNSGTAVVLPVTVATPVDPYAEYFDPNATIPTATAAPAPPPESAEAVVAREWASRTNGWL